MHIKQSSYLYLPSHCQSVEFFPPRLDSRGSQIDNLKLAYLEQLVTDLRNDNQQLFDQLEDMRVKNFEKESKYINQLNEMQEQLGELHAQNKNYEYQVQFQQSKIQLLEQQYGNIKIFDQQMSNSTDLFNSKYQSETEDQQIRNLNFMLEQKNQIIREYEEMKNQFKLTQVEQNTKLEQLNLEISNLNRQIRKLELQLINQQKQVSLYQTEAQTWRGRFLQLNKNFNKSSEQLTVTNVELDTAKRELQRMNDVRGKRRSVGSII